MTKFPRLLGGTTAKSAFNSIDIDSKENIVIGGETSDTGVAV